jgi:hypothetical protein
MGTESHYVELVFDTQTEALEDVHALVDGVGAPDKRDIIGKSGEGIDKEKHLKDKQGNKLAKSKEHQIIYAWGSLLCTVYRTKSGLIRICW